MLLFKNMSNIEKQINLFKKYDIRYYIIEGETIIVNQDVYLRYID